jgi:hypothetical protein
VSLGIRSPYPEKPFLPVGQLNAAYIQEKVTSTLKNPGIIPLSPILRVSGHNPSAISHLKRPHPGAISL